MASPRQKRARSKDLPAKLSHDILLEYLLGARIAHKLVWWDSVELAVPEGAPAVWTRFEMVGVPKSLAEAVEKPRTGDRQMVDAGAVHVIEAGAGRAFPHPDPFGTSTIGPNGGHFVFVPTGELAPRLSENAIVSYTELFDLRLSFRAIDNEKMKMPSTAKLQKTLDELAEHARDSRVSEAGGRDLLFRADTLEARIILAQRALEAAVRRPPPQPLPSSDPILGFGSVPHPVPGPRKFESTKSVGAFIQACAAVGVTRPMHIAAIAGLETAVNRLKHVPVVLDDRAKALRYWGVRKGDLTHPR